jgi:hypothetical protein
MGLSLGGVGGVCYGGFTAKEQEPVYIMALGLSTEEARVQGSEELMTTVALGSECSGGSLPCQTLPREESPLLESFIY